MRTLAGPRALIMAGAVLIAAGSLAACSSAPEPPATAADVSGTTWSGTGVGGRDCTVSFNDGGDLSGECTQTGITLGGSGSWQQTGSHITFDLLVGMAVVDHDGTIWGATMSGTYKGSDGSKGKWEFAPAN